MMRAVRTILLKNYWTSATLMVALMLWISGGPLLEAYVRSAQGNAKTDLTQKLPADQEQEGEPGQIVLTSLEAAVIPVCKIQLAFFCSFIQEVALTEKVVERVTVNVPLPQSNYFRTLFRLILPANAP